VHLARERLRTSDTALGYPALPVTGVTAALFSRPPGFATGPLAHAGASSAATAPRRRQGCCATQSVDLHPAHSKMWKVGCSPNLGRTVTNFVGLLHLVQFGACVSCCDPAMALTSIEPRQLCIRRQRQSVRDLTVSGNIQNFLPWAGRGVPDRPPALRQPRTRRLEPSSRLR
jgi:hypothetical protein